MDLETNLGPCSAFGPLCHMNLLRVKDYIVSISRENEYFVSMGARAVIAVRFPSAVACD